MASHAGTTPMDRRRDAAAAAAELVLYLEKRAARVPDLVGTVGMLEVPGGSINVVPGRCRSASTSAPPPTRCATPAPRCAGRARAICERRGALQGRGNHARGRRAQRDRPGSSAGSARCEALGLPLFRMPSGAGHDAMKLHEVMPQAMLFLRGLNAGISHNPLESITNDDTELCVRAFQHLLDHLATECHAHERLRTSSTPGSTRTSTRRCASCRSWCGAHRHAAGNNAPHAERTAEMLRLRLARRAAAVPERRGQGRTDWSRSPT